MPNTTSKTPVFDSARGYGRVRNASGPQRYLQDGNAFDIHRNYMTPEQVLMSTEDYKAMLAEKAEPKAPPTPPKSAPPQTQGTRSPEGATTPTPGEADNRNTKDNEKVTDVIDTKIAGSDRQSVRKELQELNFRVIAEMVERQEMKPATGTGMKNANIKLLLDKRFGPEKD